MAGSCPRVESGRERRMGKIKRVWGVGGINESRGGRGGKTELDVSDRNLRHRRKEARKGAGRIRKKAKDWGLMVIP